MRFNAPNIADAIFFGNYFNVLISKQILINIGRLLKSSELISKVFILCFQAYLFSFCTISHVIN